MKTTPEQSKKLILEAFDTLFNKRDYPAAEKFWSPNYIQHSAHIEPGREGLFNLIRNLPATLKWTHGTILAEDDFVIVHSRYSGHGLPAPWIGRVLHCVTLSIRKGSQRVPVCIKAGFLLPLGEGSVQRRMRGARPMTQPRELDPSERAALTRRCAPPSPCGRGLRSTR